MYLKSRFRFFMFVQDNSDYDYIFGFKDVKEKGNTE